MSEIEMTKKEKDKERAKEGAYVHVRVIVLNNVQHDIRYDLVDNQYYAMTTNPRARVDILGSDDVEQLIDDLYEYYGLDDEGNKVEVEVAKIFFGEVSVKEGQRYKGEGDIFTVVELTKFYTNYKVGGFIMKYRWDTGDELTITLGYAIEVFSKGFCLEEDV